MNPGRPIIDFSFRQSIVTAFMTFLAKFLVSVPVHALYALKISDRKNLRALGRGGFITVSNHCLYGEPIFAGMAVWPRRFWYCVEQENVDRKDVGWLCRLMGAFGIPKEKPLAVTGPVLKALDKKHVIHMFPEGVLYFRNQDIAPFFRGAFHFALAAGVPVLPMTSVLHERKAWGLFSWLPPKVEYVIGKPLHPASFEETCGSRKEALKAFSEALRISMQDTIDGRTGARNLPGAVKPPPAGSRVSDAVS